MMKNDERREIIGIVEEKWRNYKGVFDGRTLEKGGKKYNRGRIMHIKGGEYYIN